MSHEEKSQLLLSAPSKPKEGVSGETRKPTIKQQLAVEKVIENGGNKYKALKEVGYSESVAKTPERVFGSPTVIALMDRLGLDEESLTNKHKELLQAKFLGHMVFPTYSPQATEEEEEEEEDEEEDLSENIGDSKDDSEKRRGESLTDKDIRELLMTVGCTVQRIVHGEQARHVYFWSPNTKAQLTALDMAYNLRGSYAPKKLDTKGSLTVGVFSISQLHKKMRENGVKSTDIIKVEPLKDDISE